MPDDKRSKARQGDTASKIAIAGAIESELPNIKGFNLFTGEFTPDRATSIGTAVCTQDEWEAMWRNFDRLPPGPLPKGGRAVFEALTELNKPRVTAYEPVTVEVSPGEIHIAWNKLHIAKEEDPKARARYAVLLLPEKGVLKSKFNEVWPVRESREKLRKFDDTLNMFKNGRSEKLPAPPGAAFSHYRARRNTGVPGGRKN